MSHVANMRMENLFFSLKEVQNEKVCLEQKLHELKLKRHALEQELDQANSKYELVNDRHRRMAGTFAIAQQKVEQTLSRFLSLQDDVKRNQPKLNQLQSSIESEKNLQLQYIKEFEGTLSGISSELFQARDFYKKSTLHSEIERTNALCKDLEQQAENTVWEVQTLKRCLEKLIQDGRLSNTSKYGVETTLSLCQSAMQRDEKEALSYLNQTRKELKEIHDILHNTR